MKTRTRIAMRRNLRELADFLPAFLFGLLAVSFMFVGLLAGVFK